MKYKIFDFDHGLGGLSNGLEIHKEFEVVEAPLLNQDASLSYNLNHKNLFEVGRFDLSCDYDIALFTPYFGDNFLRRGANNFDFDEISRIFSFLKLNQPDYAIISTIPGVVQFMADESMHLSCTADGWPAYDYTIFAVSDFYNTFQFVIDGADYGLPQHKLVNFYLLIHNDVDFNGLVLPKKTHSLKKGFTTIRDAIGDIEGSEYSSYSSDFIKFCKKDNPQKLTWHDFNYRKQDNCAYVKEGGSAKKTKDLSQKTGYVRPKYDKICPLLDADFFRVSSKKASIHPLKDRPFTIREGARLFGLPDTYVWNSGLSKKKVADMIYNSVSPIFGDVIARILKNGM